MEFNKLYNMDCLEGMRDIPDGEVDLIVCDPPYGTINGLGKNTDLRKEDGYSWDVVIPTADLFAQFFRVLRNNGTLVLFSAEPYTSHLRTFSQPCLEFTYPLIWLKRSTGNPLKAKIAPLSFFEDVSVWRKRVDVTSYDHPLREYARQLCEFMQKDYKQVGRDFAEKGYERPTRAQHFLAWDARQFHLCTAETYALLTDDYNLTTWVGYREFSSLQDEDQAFKNQQTENGETFNIPNGSSYVSNVLEFRKDLDTFHPTQKPVALIAHLIRIFSNPGDVVLDACMGSATTAVAAIRTGRNWIGYEMNEKFYKQAQKRIEHALATPTLF
jgi:site-specific DNA-methyltransferase (adenine-specific)